MNYGPPITASPARLRADPAKLSYIRTWIKDFPDDSLSNDADAITEKLKELSFASFASLNSTMFLVISHYAVLRGSRYGKP